MDRTKIQVKEQEALDDTDLVVTGASGLCPSL